MPYCERNQDSNENRKSIGLNAKFRAIESIGV